MRDDARVADIVQAGAIRLALFLPQYTKDESGALRGIGTGHIALEVVRALAERLGVRMQVIEQPTPPEAVECLKAGGCDVLFFGVEPSRVTQVDFTPPVFQFDYTCLVPASSSIQRFADADRPGRRIAIVQSHASALALKRIVKHAEFVGAELPDEGFELLRAGKADAFALPRDQLLDYSATLPGSRVLDEAYGINRVAAAVKKGRSALLASMGEFVEEAKASGLVQRAIDSGNLHEFQVSPPAGNA
jgi:polar amino acid transport system substrate-binding protein